MRTKAERLTQIRNALAACAASLLCAAAVSVITYFCFKPAAVMLFVVFATAFALALAVLILLWKKTDLLRNVLYLIHCIRNPTVPAAIGTLPAFQISGCMKILKDMIPLGSKNIVRMLCARSAIQLRDRGYLHSGPRRILVC